MTRPVGSTSKVETVRTGSADAEKVAEWMRRAAEVSTDTDQALRFRDAEVMLMALVRRGERIPDVQQMLVVRREAVAVLGGRR